MGSFAVLPLLLPNFAPVSGLFGKFFQIDEISSFQTQKYVLYYTKGDSFSPAVHERSDLDEIQLYL
jgi:hypothetical protein